MKYIPAFLIPALFLWGGQLFGQPPMQLAPPIPVISQVIFQDSICVELVLDMDDVNIEWRAGDGPWNSYRSPIVWHESAVFSVRTTAKGYRNSDKISFDVIKTGMPLRLVSQPISNPKYPGVSLTDGIKASTNYHDVQWKGYDQDSVTFKIAADEHINSLRLEFLEDPNAWILKPLRVSAKAISDKGQSLPTRINAHVLQANAESVASQATMRSFWIDLPELTDHTSVVYWEITVEAATLPQDHPGAGNKAWIFIDEILAY